MATLKYLLYSEKNGKLANIYARVCIGKGKDFIVKSGKMVSPENWSNKTEATKQRTYSKDNEDLRKTLSDLKESILKEVSRNPDNVSKEWLSKVIYRFHNQKSVDAETLTEYIDRFIVEAENGERRNKHNKDFEIGTMTNFKAFRDRFNDYQKTKGSVDFEDVEIDFYNNFVSYLTKAGYRPNTIGKHIKTLKMFMSKSLQDKKHHNRDYQLEAFRGVSEKSFSVYLTGAELDKLYIIDLDQRPELDLARDAFLVLCETALRISDYPQVDINIRTDEDGFKFIHIHQKKTGGEVIFPVSPRLQSILDKYHDKLPKIRDQYINKRIKIIAKECGFTEKLQFEYTQYGKTYPRTAKKYELITCHTGRRTGCTNMYLAGIPSIDIMKISGHSTETNFLKYIKMDKLQTAKRLSVHPYFNLRVAK